MQARKKLNRLFQSGSCPAALFAKGKYWVAKDRESKIASRKVRKAHVMFLFFFMTRWLMFVNLWNERVHPLMIVYDCDLQKISRWAPKFPKRTAKDPPKDRKMHWAKSTSHPAKSPCLWPHFYGENLSFSSAFHSSILFLFLSPSPDGPMRCVKRRWANSLPTPD